MRRTLAILASCLLLPAPAFAQPIIFPDGSSSDNPGGLMIIRKGNQTTWSLGGAFLPRRVKVVTQTPEGKDVVRFRLPAVFNSPDIPMLPDAAPANLQIEVPDEHALLFVEGEMVRSRGTSRQLESPKLPPGKDYPVRLRAAYVVGNNFVIEDKQLMLRAGEASAIRFDGSR